MKAVGERIKNLRIDHDLYQKDLANYLDISQQYYSEYENGKRDLPLRHIKKICIYYKVSADYIIGLPKGLQHPER